MKTKHMDVACYSILLVAVAIVGIQLTSPPGSVSGQEEEESVISSIAQDGQNAQDSTQLTTPASVSGQEEEESTITPIAQDDQNAQNGPGVFPRIASVDDSAKVANSADATGNEVAPNGADATGNEEVKNGADATGNEEAKNGADAANGGTNNADGTDLANGGFGANGADGVGRDGADGATGAADGEDGADAFALQLEAVIP